MKKRNPLFVAGFPYSIWFIAYSGMQISSLFSFDKNTLHVAFLLALWLSLFTAVGYFLYWLISTATVLRNKTGQKIPPAILLIVPLVNYLWFWRYSQAVEIYTSNKAQTALAFLLLVAAGPIGAGILQDYYNKVSLQQEAQPPDQQTTI